MHAVHRSGSSCLPCPASLAPGLHYYHHTVILCYHAIMLSCSMLHAAAGRNWIEFSACVCVLDARAFYCVAHACMHIYTCMYIYMFVCVCVRTHVCNRERESEPCMHAWGNPFRQLFPELPSLIAYAETSLSWIN